MTRALEKLEVRKSTGVYHYTGYVTTLEDGNLLVETIKDERLIFRPEQIDSRRIMAVVVEGDGTNGKEDYHA